MWMVAVWFWIGTIGSTDIAMIRRSAHGVATAATGDTVPNAIESNTTTTARRRSNPVCTGPTRSTRASAHSAQPHDQRTPPSNQPTTRDKTWTLAASNTGHARATHLPLDEPTVGATGRNVNSTRTGASPQDDQWIGRFAANTAGHPPGHRHDIVRRGLADDSAGTCPTSPVHVDDSRAGSHPPAIDASAEHETAARRGRERAAGYGSRKCQRTRRSLARSCQLRGTTAPASRVRP